MKPTDQDIVSALKKVAITYSRNMAITIERLYRNETRHFESGNWPFTLSPGMEVAHDSKGRPIMAIPYGWGSLREYWTLYPNYAPTGTFKQKENASLLSKSRGERIFIVFPNVEASMMSVAFVINKRGGDGGSWFSVSDEDVRFKYNEALAQIKPRYVTAHLS